ncbi:PREDICTED: serine/threonine-protein kinase PAK 2-like [Acropora digitifera]|uniref:serine/threonine-protein kinase PAK 2-like n=1 Tax=Acropora digitifera TaxID=70779 RepID=UPI00077A19DC|nr:PREDICTED: serine/threonine-protein kinase PAK 2-like [Acropora digitifera]
MSLPSCVPAISSNEKKEDATQNIPDSPLLASGTLSNAEENSSHQPKQRCGEEDEAAEARDRETDEVMSAHIEEENFSLEALLEKLPPPPSHHPDDTKDGATCSTIASAPSTSSVHRAFSGGSSLSTRSIASSDLPLSLSPGEEKLVWPLQETFDIKDNQFEEGVQYDIIEDAGYGAFGKCYVASKSSDPTLFCIKKCQYKVNEILALYLAKTENIKEIVDFYGAKLEGRNAYICMEFMTGETISELVEEKKAGIWPIISEDTCFVFLEDILKGLKFLNGKGLVHRDIKGDNVLLDEARIHAKLTDFGSAEDIQPLISKEVWIELPVVLEPKFLKPSAPYW